MGTGPICLQAVFVLTQENHWKFANLNSTIEYTSIHRSEKKLLASRLKKSPM